MSFRTAYFSAALSAANISGGALNAAVGGVPNKVVMALNLGAAALFGYGAFIEGAREVAARISASRPADCAREPLYPRADR